MTTFHSDLLDPREHYLRELPRQLAKRQAEYLLANEAVKAKEARIKAAMNSEQIWNWWPAQAKP